MHVLFLFLDGVGLGEDDPTRNPFVQANMPNLRQLLGGRPLTLSALHPTGRLDSGRASLLGLDPIMGVSGVPQSATGQATLLTGINVPAEIGYHYGPKPNPPIAAFLQNGSLFSRLSSMGLKSRLLNAYPPTYFSAIHSGKRIYSAIPLAVTEAGIALLTRDDLLSGHALAVDFTGEGWHTHLMLTDTPLLSPYQAGQRLASLSRNYSLAFFEYWLSDYAGHHQDMDNAVAILEIFDQMLAGLLTDWQDSTGLILLTSDHGNLEDLSTRRHTLNLVPALLIGDQQLREQFGRHLTRLSDVAPAIIDILSPT